MGKLWMTGKQVVQMLRRVEEELRTRGKVSLPSLHRHVILDGWLKPKVGQVLQSRMDKLLEDLSQDGQLHLLPASALCEGLLADLFTQGAEVLLLRQLLPVDLGPPGVALRLFTRRIFEDTMAEFDTPEILRTSLSRLFLRAKRLSEVLQKTAAKISAQCPLDLSSARALLGSLPQPPSAMLVSRLRPMARANEASKKDDSDNNVSSYSPTFARNLVNMGDLSEDPFSEEN
eukprot:g29003.t1